METDQMAAPPTQAQNLPSQPQQPPVPGPASAPAPARAPAPAPAPPPMNTKKRPLDSIGHLQDSPYYKMRAVVRDLRPHFLEVLRTPDFRNCKAAEEIREKMKIVMDLYKELTAETTILEKCQNVPASKSLPGEPKDEQEHRQDMKPPEKPPTDRVFTRHADSKPPFYGSISQNQQSEDGRVEGTYIVGGSAFGWNFVTFPGNKAIYYGRTKESFRSANVKSQ